MRDACSRLHSVYTRIGDKSEVRVTRWFSGGPCRNRTCDHL